MMEYSLPPSARVAERMLAWLMPPDLRPPPAPEYASQERQRYAIPVTTEPVPRPPTRLADALAPDGPHQHHYGLSPRGLCCVQCLVPYQVIRRQLAEQEEW